VKHPVIKILLGISTAVFWEDVVRPELVVADLTRTQRRKGRTGGLVRWHGPAPQGLPFETGSLGTILLIDAVEQSLDPTALIDEAKRVAKDVHILLPRPWSPATWVNPKIRWVLLGTELHPVPGRKAKPRWLPKGVSVVRRHATPFDSVKRLVEAGVKGALE
jgi:hypothetical protein